MIFQLEPQLMLLLIFSLLFALTFHEFAHAAIAYICGDGTAKYMGRLTLNPLAHLDLFGSLMLLFAGFGYAKPVPVNFSNLRNPKKDMLWVALAGPGANLIMAIFWTIIYSNQLFFPNMAQSFIGVMAIAGIQINIVLMVLNLLPFPPLDGGRVAVSLLPYPWSGKLAGLERYGFFILIFLLATGILGAILSPLIRVSQNVILTIFG